MVSQTSANGPVRRASGCHARMKGRTDLRLSRWVGWSFALDVFNFSRLLWVEVS